MRRAWLVALLLLGWALVAGVGAAPVPVPPLAARVTDQTRTLDAAQQQALEAKLAAFENATGGQIAILMVPTTGDETIEQFSIRVVDAWKLGRKGVDDGVLVLVAKDDRTMRIEVGRGFEGVLPDAIASRIIDGFVTAKFAAGDFAGGLNDGVDRIIGVVNGAALPQPTQPVSGPATALAPTAALATGSPIPPLVGHVVNQTTLMTQAQTMALEGRLSGLEAQTGRKTAILLVESTGGETVDHYADRVYDAWGLDGARKDGVLLLKSGEPFGERIVVGRDLQDTITPAIADRILFDFMVPKFIGSDVATGMEAGLDRIVDLENGKGLPLPEWEKGSDWEPVADAFAPPPFGTWIMTLVVMIFVGISAAAMLGHTSTILRGGGTGLAVLVVPLIAGSGILFALCFAAVAAYLSGKYGEDDGTPTAWSSGGSSGSSVSGWSIFGDILGMAVGSAIRSGGGGFRGGGGGFSGGGASGRW